MDLRPISDSQKTQYNKKVTHIIQSWQWGEFRKSLGTPLFRYGLYQNGKLKKVFQLTLHKIPFTKKYVGYLPKGPTPDKDLAKALHTIGKAHNCAFIKVEPNILSSDKSFTLDPLFKLSPKTYFTKYNFFLDLTKTEDELLVHLHSKTRYNIRLAQKKGVIVEERTDKEAFEIYLKLYFETTQRQGYLGHDHAYHKKAWDLLKKEGIAKLLIAFYTPEGSTKKIPLSAWMLLVFRDTLYYPYGGSSLQYREVMANNLIAWEAIKLGKKLNLKKFDMWGAANTPNPLPSDPFIGFHRFKEGYGGELVEYLGTFDLILDKPIYHLFNLSDKNVKLKSFLLKLIGR